MSAPGILFVAGMNHRTAPVATREQLALEEEKIREILSDLTGRGLLDEVMILSTCNRVEVYGVGAGAGVARAGGVGGRVRRARLRSGASGPTAACRGGIWSRCSTR
jgi:glutamyl-tRNA reductase